MEKPDSILFDMDGTLWDAVNLYVYSWNETFKELKIQRRVAREDLTGMMGWEGVKVLEKLLPEFEIDRRKEIYRHVNDLRRKMLPKVGGILYEGVKEGIEKLSKKYKLFIVSNCAEGIVERFCNWAAIDNCIIDNREYGTNYKPKHINIQLLIEEYSLERPIYVGDTEGDSEQSQLAGIPFVFLDFGFGETTDYALKFNSFPQFTQYFLSL